jgi:DNA-binding response OmpR family regulator
MALECLLVTCDSTLLAQVKSIINTHAASLDLRQDSVSAIELTGRCHWDGPVVDCDDVAGGTEALAKVRSSRSNNETVIVAVVNGSTSVGTALDLGANSVLRKPIQETRLRSV